MAPICILFVGSSPPSSEWLHTKAKPLAVHVDKVCKALIWLKAHNPLYADIEINHDVLNQLPTDNILPFHVEHVHPLKDGDALTLRYDMALAPTDSSDHSNVNVTFQKLIITDVDGHASSNEL